MRLTHDREFQAVFDARVRQTIHPIVVCARPNALDRCRLGLSVSRKVNSAVKRNRIKRLVREAFRLMQQEFPAPYDLVVVARPHEPRELSWYQQALREGAQSVHRQWTTRQQQETSQQAKPGDRGPDSSRDV